MKENIGAVADGNSGEIFLQDPFHRISSVCAPVGVAQNFHLVKPAVSSAVPALLLRVTTIHTQKSEM